MLAFEHYLQVCSAAQQRLLWELGSISWFASTSAVNLDHPTTVLVMIHTHCAKFQSSMTSNLTAN